MTTKNLGASVRAAAVAACVLGASACGSANPTSPPPATTTVTLAPTFGGPAVASPTPPGQPSAAPTSGPTVIADWARLPDPFGKGVAGYLDAVAAYKGGFIAVGTTDDAVAITSGDGLTWSSPTPLPGGAGAYVDALAVGPDLIVAAGSSSGCCGGGGRALLWTSKDGSTWQRVPNEAGFADAGISGLAAVGHGFVAVGIANTTEVANDAAFWYSPDGLAWTRLTSVPGLKTGWMNGVTSSASGIVAVGTRGNPNIGPSAVWTSSDGKTWKLAKESAALESGVMQAVTSLGDAFVAVGRDADGHAQVWRSGNGSSWTLDVPQPSSSASFAGFDDIVVIGAQLVGLEQVSMSPSPSASVVWTWSDPAGWAIVPTGTVFASSTRSSSALRAAVGLAGRIVVVGFGGIPDAIEPAIWVSPSGP